MGFDFHEGGGRYSAEEMIDYIMQEVVSASDWIVGHRALQISSKGELGTTVVTIKELIRGSNISNTDNSSIKKIKLD